jgi:ABC-type multidrug transport system ATPase subunit
MSSLVLRARGLRKSYEDLVALEPLDLDITAGELVVLVGHNGAGKTTLTNMIAGLLEPTEGEIEISGHAAGTSPARAHLSYLPDAPSLYDDLSVREHAQYIAGMHDIEDWVERTAELLVRLNLDERADDLPSRFSRGLRQKTSILLGLVRPFSLLVADEPFVGLDGAGRETFIELMRGAARDGAGVLVSTHQLEFIEHADRLIALRNGELIYDGTARGVNLSELAS